MARVIYRGWAKADDPIYQTGSVVGGAIFKRSPEGTQHSGSSENRTADLKPTKTKGGFTWHGFVPDTDPIYTSGSIVMTGSAIHRPTKVDENNERTA